MTDEPRSDKPPALPQRPAEFAPQGSPEWHADRQGKITASEFKTIVTPVKCELSTSKKAQQYIREVASEILTGQAVERPTTKAMQWGHEYELMAREVYEARYKCTVEQVGFCPHPEEPLIGGSADGLVGREGGIEIKCPQNPAIHMGHKLDGMPAEHKPQVQGHLWLRHRKWWDFVSFHPWFTEDIHQALVAQRFERDEAYIEKLAEAVFAAVETLKQTLEEMRSK
jgi:hypothetical protein